MQKVTVNTFSGGLDKDISQNFIPNNKYADALNVTITNNSDFFAVTDIKGTTEEGDILEAAGFPTNSKVLGMYNARGYNANNGGNFVEGFVIFLYDTSNLEIYFYSLDDQELYLLFTEAQDSPYNGEVDAIKYTEASIDTIYFTDGVNEPRHIKINIPSGASSSSAIFNEEEVSVLRRATYARVDLDSVDTGGNLLCGTYQFAVRLFNNTTNRYTKWSILTSPIHVSEAQRNPTDDNRRIRGGVGQFSGKEINLDITITTAESNSFEYYQLAVIENTTTTDNLLASLLQPQSITASITAYDFVYSANRGLDTIDLSDITVDRAAIKTCKTLTIKNNRLFMGNIEYYDLEYDNGDPSVTSGSIITEDGSSSMNDDTSSDDNFVSLYTGYQRGDVYRYAISYFDEFYNFSRPKVLDLNGITDNQISGSIPDVKFPNQKDDVGYGYINSSSGRVQHLGLNITIDDHPTWAKGFVILKARRIKGIEFQTPYVPMTYINGAVAYDNYPTTAVEEFGAGTVAYDDAQPMNPLGTYVPKNYLFTLNRHLIDVGQDNNNFTWIYSSILDYYALIFPPSSIYDTDNATDPGFTFSNQTGELIDVAFLKLNYTSHETGPTLPDAGGNATDGDFINTSVTNNLYAIESGDYYYAGASGSLSDPTSADDMNFSITDYEFIPNNSSGAIINNTSILNHGNLETTGISWGVTPTANRSAVIRTYSPAVGGGATGFKSDITIQADPGGNGLQPSSSTGIPASHFLTQGNFNYDNTFAYDRANFSENSSYVSAVEIVNVINPGLEDNRYGDVEDRHEFFTTGTYHVFTPAQLSDVEAGNTEPITVDVFGGDSFTSLHSYKLSDGHYGVQDPADDPEDILAKWNRYFTDSGGTPMSLPVPYDNFVQILSVVHESDVRASVLDSPVFDGGSSTFDDGDMIPAQGGEESGKIPFTYFYNRNYSAEADQKIFIPFQEFELNNNVFNSRIVYSNQRIYQSDIVGFDLFNVLDFYDMDEVYGEINKVTLIKDKFLAFQNTGISYVPTSSRVLETSDANTISVRSGEVLDTPILITNTFGAQSPNSVYSGPNFTYYIDHNKKVISRITADLGNDLISNKGLSSTLIENLNSDVTNDLILYSPSDQMVYFRSLDDLCYSFSEKLNLWVSELSLSETLLGADHINDKLYAMGLDADSDLKIWEFNSSINNTFFGEDFNSNISFIVNEDPFISKVFDNLIINADGTFEDCTVQGFVPSGINPLSDAIDLDISPNGEGAYRVKVLRDSGGRRIRGARSLIKINWKSPSTAETNLFSVATKYRVSQRAI